jgi:hypothetical protein
LVKENRIAADASAAVGLKKSCQIAGLLKVIKPTFILGYHNNSMHQFSKITTNITSDKFNEKILKHTKLLM